MKTIGLCMSGGGHRATIFSLGVLLYLVDAGRRRDVRIISSVSGGSLTNAFFATQEKTLHELTPDEFEECAARLANQIAGNPSCWNLTMVGLMLLWVGFGAQLGMSHFQTGWWMWQIALLGLILVWACLVGPRSGGTFWAWWGTWFYVGLLVPALILAVAVWWSPLSWKWCLAYDILASLPLGLRSWVADKAFGATICKPASNRHNDTIHSSRHDPQYLAHIHPTPRHVFCATEMHTGHHAYFSHDLVYDLDQGLGVPANLPLTTAVQVSANFPVAFPYRILQLERHDFRLGLWSRGKHLVLSDGGIHDNMATAWFSEIPRMIPKLQRWLNSAAQPETGSSTPPLGRDVRERLQEQINAITEQPDVLIIVNSSVSYFWGAVTATRIPILGELFALTKISDVMYNREGVTQSAKWRRRFLDRPGTGLLVSIEEQPGGLVSVLTDEHKLWREYFQLEEHHIEQYLPRAQRLKDRLRMENEDQSAKVKGQVQDLNSAIEALKTKLTGLEQYSTPRLKIENEILDLEIKRSTLEMDEGSRRSERALESSKRTQEFRRLTDAASVVATTFRPLGRATTAALLYHAYWLCMINSSLLLEFPWLDNAPTIEDCERLAAGCRRKSRPTAPDTTQ